MPTRRLLRASARSVAEGATMLPASVLLLAGRSGGIVTGVFRSSPDRSPGLGRRVTHGVSGLLLGSATLVLLLVALLAVARGALYPVFDQGPYGDSWGGPTLVGAWAVHLAVSVPLLVAALALVSGVVGLNRNLTAPMTGRRTSWWAWPLAVVICLVTVLFVVAWSQQA